MAPLGEFSGGLVGSGDINQAFDAYLWKVWKYIKEASTEQPEVLERFRQRDFMIAHRVFDEYKCSFDGTELPRRIEFIESVGMSNVTRAGINDGVLEIST